MPTGDISYTLPNTMLLTAILPRLLASAPFALSKSAFSTSATMCSKSSVFEKLGGAENVRAAVDLVRCLVLHRRFADARGWASAQRVSHGVCLCVCAQHACAVWQQALLRSTASQHNLTHMCLRQPGPKPGR